MKSSSALFFQVVIVLIGIGALALLLWEPHLEGRNAHATTFEIYFNDPFLAYAYAGSTPFFVGLYRAFKLFEHLRQNRAYSRVTVDALRAIRNCAIAQMAFVAGAAVFIVSFGDGEDHAGGVFMCFLVILASSVVAIAARMFARKILNALGRFESTGT